MDMVIGRLTNFVVDAASGVIYAGDDRGLIYQISADLSCVVRSAGTSHGVAIHGITQDSRCVYTRDVAGNIVQWARDGLYPIQFILSQHCTEEKGDTPVPSPSNAISCVGQYLLACNSYGTLSVFEREDMIFIKEIDAAGDAFPEKICAHGDVVFLSDVKGSVYKGSVGDAQFTQIAEVAGGVIHSIVADPRFDRLWCTSDVTGGVFFVDFDGRLLGEERITNDDVEEVVFDRQGARAYVGCFDHHVHVIENQLQPKEVGCIGPFKFQINHLALQGDSRLLVLLESGELHLVDLRDGQILAQVGGTNAIWNVALNGADLLCAAEHGNLERFRIASRNTSLTFVREARGPGLHSGRIRQLKGIGDGVVCGTTEGTVISVGAEGNIRWRTRTGGIVRDLDVDLASMEVVICNEVGEILLLDVATGGIKRRFKNRKPVWCVAFDEDRHIVFGERTLTTAAGPYEPSHLCFLSRDTFDERIRLPRSGNHKRIRRLPDHRILINGNGAIGVQVLNTRTFEIEKTFSDWIINTPENAVIHGDRVYAVTYGYQLITYALSSSEAIDVQYVTEGYPKALEVFVNADGAAFLILSGRNFLMAFLIGEDAPELVCTRYLYDVTPDDRPTRGSERASHAEQISMKRPTRVLERTLSAESLETST